MYACIFKLTRTWSVKTSISDNFLVCGLIWVHDASFWSCWPKDSFKIILVAIRCPEKNQAETLEMHGFPCRNARSPNWVQVVSLWLCWPNDLCDCIFMSIGCPEQIGTENPKCAQICVSGFVFGFLVLKTLMHVMNGMWVEKWSVYNMYLKLRFCQSNMGFLHRVVWQQLIKATRSISLASLFLNCPILTPKTK